MLWPLLSSFRTHRVYIDPIMDWQVLWQRICYLVLEFRPQLLGRYPSRTCRTPPWTYKQYSCTLINSGFPIASRTLSVPFTLISVVSCGFFHDSETELCAARWNMKSGFTSSNSSFMLSLSVCWAYAPYSRRHWTARSQGTSPRSDDRFL